MLLMWTVAVAVYFTCKLASFIPAKSASLKHNLFYLFLWPGLDANTFLHSAKPQPTSLSEWIFAFVKMLFGVILVTFNIPIITIIGIVLFLHFGLFHVISLIWRSFGFDAKPLMNWPMLSVSLGDFWGNRWNTAFRDLSHYLIFKPMVRLSGVNMATIAVFTVSGIVHDVVMSIPAGSGYGGPFLYFIIQCVGLFVEKEYKLLRGRLFTMLVVLLPLPLLLHEGFTNLFMR